ncbi:hypothetical protein ABPG72_018624 [Tetrahymena utriculariae]
MKFTGIPILLLVLLFLSTSMYLVMHQNKIKFINLYSELEDISCLNIEIIVEEGCVSNQSLLYLKHLLETQKIYFCLLFFDRQYFQNFDILMLRVKQKVEDTSPLVQLYSNQIFLGKLLNKCKIEQTNIYSSLRIIMDIEKFVNCQLKDILLNLEILVEKIRDSWFFRNYRKSNYKQIGTSLHQLIFYQIFNS